MTNTGLRPLTPLNTNYNPPRPWACITHESHDCTGTVIGALGAIPVCASGAVAQQAARDADRARRDALLATPEMQRILAKEARIERWIETR